MWSVSLLGRREACPDDGGSHTPFVRSATPPAVAKAQPAPPRPDRRLTADGTRGEERIAGHHRRPRESEQAEAATWPAGIVGCRDPVTSGPCGHDECYLYRTGRHTECDITALGVLDRRDAGPKVKLGRPFRHLPDRQRQTTGRARCGDRMRRPRAAGLRTDPAQSCPGIGEGRPHEVSLARPAWRLPSSR